VERGTGRRPTPFERARRAAEGKKGQGVRGCAQQRSSPTPLPPLFAKPVHLSRAPKRRRPHRICAEGPPPFSLFNELRCLPSPSQNGRTSSCSLSLSLVPKNPTVSSLAVRRRHRCRKPTVPPLLRHLNGDMPPR
jgi:hypothetical protein